MVCYRMVWYKKPPHTRKQKRTRAEGRIEDRLISNDMTDQEKKQEEEKRDSERGKVSDGSGDNR